MKGVKLSVLEKSGTKETEARKYGSVQVRVLDWLKQNADVGFGQRDIQKALELSREQSARSAAMRLVAKGKIERFSMVEKTDAGRTVTRVYYCYRK